MTTLKTCPSISFFFAFKHARFGLEMVMVTDVLNANIELDPRRTNNDEHTPGVFEVG